MKSFEIVAFLLKLYQFVICSKVTVSFFQKLEGVKFLLQLNLLAAFVEELSLQP